MMMETYRKNKEVESNIHWFGANSKEKINYNIMHTNMKVERLLVFSNWKVHLCHLFIVNFIFVLEIRN